MKDTSQFHEDFMKNDNEKSDEWYFLEVDVQYFQKLLELRNDLSILTERMKNGKFGKLVRNLYDKNEYVVHIKNLKQALNNGLVLKKIHKVIKFNQNSWVIPYIDIHTDIRKKAKNDFENSFFKLMNNVGFKKNYGKSDNTKRY